MNSENALDQYLSSWTLNSLLVKVANVCNFKCRYCFWFSNCKKEATPDFLSIEIEDCLIQKLETYFLREQKKYFRITLHGGEPLLLGLDRLRRFIDKLNKVALKTGTEVRYVIQTNGSLINLDWIKFFKEYNIILGISFDGPKPLQDLNRLYANGSSTHSDVCSSISLLKQNEVPFGVLCVCNPLSSPKDVLKYFVDELKIRSFDILIPDITHDSAVKTSIKDFYTNLFDDWVENYLKRDVQIRFFENVLKSLLFLGSTCETIGYGPMNVFTIETNGDIGPTDTLVICGENYWKPTMNIVDCDLHDIKNDPFIRSSILSALILPAKCIKCKFSTECGGGYLPHRWSEANSFNNHSVYCDDLFLIYSHIEKFMIENTSEETLCVGE